MTLSVRLTLTGGLLPYNILLGPWDELLKLFDPNMTTALSLGTLWADLSGVICARDLNTHLLSTPTSRSALPTKELSLQT